MKVKNNGVITYQAAFTDSNTMHLFGPIDFIIPANTSLDITFQNADASSHIVGVSCYGKYLSM